MIRIKEAMEKIKPYGSKTQPIVNGYCLEGKIPCQRCGNLWYVDEKFIDSAIQWKKQEAVTIEQLIEENKGIEKLSETQKKLCLCNIRKKIGFALVNTCGYALLFSGNFVDPEKIESVREIIRNEVDAYSTMQDRMLITDVAKETGISTYKLKNDIKAGKIKTAQMVKGNWTIERSELPSIGNENGLIGIYDFSKKMLLSIKTTFDLDNRNHRALLVVFLKKSNLSGYLQTWEQAGLHGDRKNALYFPDFISDKMEKLLLDYFKHYGPIEERLKQLATDDYWKTHKRTYQALIKFSETKTTGGMVALFEIIMNCLSCEIMDATDDDINHMADYAQYAPTQIYSRYLVQFLSFVKSEYEDCTFSVVLNYRKDQNKKNIIQTAPYPLHMYMSAAYMCFNQKFIDEHDLVGKSLENYKYAVLWLNMCWHYVGAWRTSDIFRMKIIPLLHEKDEVRHMIESGEYKDEAIAMSLLLENEINGSHAKPHKTKDSQDNGFLVITFPESLRFIIGLVYSICCIHCKDKLVKKRLEVKDYIAFFGDSYRKIFGNQPFLNRRANKSFEDAIAEITERDSVTSNKLLGYIVASYARGHSFKSGNLSSVTYKYLQTKMDGYSVNEILMMLWESGTCSFIPYMLLAMVYGEQFEQLTFQQQSQMISMSKLTALSAENISDLVQKVQVRSNAVLDRIFYNYNNAENRQTIANQMLMNIVQREAVGKQMGVSCLCAARRVPCAHTNRQDCLGCEYAIYEHGLFFFAVQRIRIMYEKLGNARTDGERRKISGMLEDIYLPAVYEMMLFSKEQYGMNIEAYKNEIVELMNGGATIAANIN